MKINPYIFRQYDIRGVVGEDLDEDFARRLGQAFGTYSLKNNETSVIVGCDNRISSPSLKKAVTEGLLSTGCNVVDIGTVVTPIFYYARIHFNINPGIMVTASHNNDGKRRFHVRSRFDYL